MNPHIAFSGRALEALTFYQTLFGGESEVFTVGERVVLGMPKDAIFHSDLKGMNFRLMAADAPSNESGRISLHILCEDKDELDRYHNALSEDGFVHCEVGPAFGGLFSMVTDRFGINWYLTLPD